MLNCLQSGMNRITIKPAFENVLMSFENKHLTIKIINSDNFFNLKQ